MSGDSVSVIIPAYNAEHCLGRCLDSVRAQSLAAAEIIVIDDGSTDETSAVASGYPEVILLRQENLGQGAARNAGLERARGDQIAFLDADDFWRPGILEACCRFLAAHPEAVAVSTGLVVRSRHGRETVRPRLSAMAPRPEPFVIDDFFSFWAEHDHVRTGSNVIRRSVIERVGPQRADLRLSQDLEYWGLIATSGPWGFIPEPLWVGDSRHQATANWAEKYAERRRLCPTVEAWQERILPRLLPRQLPAFERVRGRVAAGFALSKILAGDSGEALEIVRRYGPSMPDNPVTRLQALGARGGRAGWSLVCRLLRAREAVKAKWLRRRSTVRHD